MATTAAKERLRACPACGAEGSGAAPVVSSRPSAEELVVSEVAPYWHGRMKRRVFFPYHRCRRCGQLFCPVYFSEEELRRLYGEMADNTAGVPADVIQRTQEGYFDVLQRHAALRGRYLEIGPDLGFIARRCFREGSFEEFWLFEPKASVQAALRKELKGSHVHIVPDFFNLETVPDGAMTVAVMVHVLDHLLDPKAALRELTKKMGPDGVLLLVTHDESSLLARILRSGWGGYSLEHPLLFGPRTLHAFLEGNGWRVRTMEKSYNWFPLTHLVQQAVRAVGWGSLPWLSGGPAVRLKLGNLITVAVKEAV